MGCVVETVVVIGHVHAEWLFMKPIKVFPRLARYRAINNQNRKSESIS